MKVGAKHTNFFSKYCVMIVYIPDYCGPSSIDLMTVSSYNLTSYMYPRDFPLAQICHYVIQAEYGEFGAMMVTWQASADDE